MKSWKNHKFKYLSNLMRIASIGIFISLPVLARPFFYPRASFFQPTAYYFQSDDTPTVTTILEELNEFNSFANSLKETGLFNTLKPSEIFTIFAPTNEAFQALPEDIQKQLYNPEKLEAVLKYHIVPALITEENIQEGKITTLDGKTVQISGIPQGDEIGVQLNDAVAQNPITANNGLVITIDKVLLPPEFELGSN